jgi:DeoR/GlpR family transcriptional regulator of sugar metabolism
MFLVKMKFKRENERRMKNHVRIDYVAEDEKNRCEFLANTNAHCDLYTLRVSSSHFFISHHQFHLSYCILTPSYPSKHNIFIFMADRDLISNVRISVFFISTSTSTSLKFFFTKLWRT